MSLNSSALKRRLNKAVKKLIPLGRHACKHTDPNTWAGGYRKFCLMFIVPPLVLLCLSLFPFLSLIPPLLMLSGWGCESQGVGVNTKEGGWHLQYLSAQQLHCTHLSLLYVNTGRPRGHKHPHKFLQIVSLANIHWLKAAGITEHMAALEKGA